MQHDDDPPPHGGDAFLEHEDALRRLARGLVGASDDAEDVLQDAWIAARKSRPKHVVNLPAWLREIVRARALTHRRSRARRSAHEALAAREETVSGADEAAADASVVAFLREAVAELPEPYREAIRLRYLEELDHARVAERLGRNESTVRSQVRRGLALLRERLDRKYGGREAWALLFARADERTALAPRPAARLARPRVAVAGLVLVAGAIVLVAATRFGGAREPASAVEVASVPERRDRASTEPSDPGIARASTEPAPARDVAIEGSTSAPGGAPDSTAPASGAASVAPEIAGGAKVVVEVVDALGAPVAGARVRSRHADGSARDRGVADASGRLAIVVEPDERALIGEGWFSVEASSEHHALSNVASVWLARVDASDGAAHLRVVAGGEPAEWHARVLDADGRCVAGARVRLGTDVVAGQYRADQTAIAVGWVDVISDARGDVDVRDLSAGEYELQAAAPGHATRFDRATIDGRPDRRVEIRLERCATIRGRVYDADGTPEAGARVWFDVRASLVDASTVAAADGSFAIARAEPTRLRVWAASADAPERTATALVDLAPGATHEWNPVLAPTSGLRVRLVDEERRPLAGHVLGFELDLPSDDVSQPGGRFRWMRGGRSGADGRLVVPDCPPLPVRALLFDERTSVGGARDVVHGLKPDGRLYQIQVLVEDARFASVRGRIRDADGSALDVLAAEIARPGGEETVAAVVDRASGAFEVAGLAPGDRELQILVPMRGRIAVAIGGLAGGEQRDLGELRAPVPGRVVIDGEHLPPFEEGQRFALYARAVDRGASFAARIGEWKGGKGRELALFPAAYSIVLEHRRGAVVQRDVHVESGRTYRLRYDVDDVLALPLVLELPPELDPTSAGAIELACELVLGDERRELFRRSVAFRDGAYATEVELAVGTYAFVARANGAGLRRELTVARDSAVETLHMALQPMAVRASETR